MENRFLILEIPIRNWNENTHDISNILKNYIRNTYKELKLFWNFEMLWMWRILEIPIRNWNYERGLDKNIYLYIILEIPIRNWNYNCSLFSQAILNNIRNTYKELKQYSWASFYNWSFSILEIPIRNWNMSGLLILFFIISSY